MIKRLALLFTMFAASCSFAPAFAMPQNSPTDPTPIYSQGSLATTYLTASQVNFPSTIAAGANWATAPINAGGFNTISVELASSQAGTVSVQRYSDDGTLRISQGTATTAALTANTYAVLNVPNDGLPFDSFMVKVTNSGGSTATISNLKIKLRASNGIGTAGTGGSSLVDTSPQMAAALTTGSVAPSYGYVVEGIYQSSPASVSNGYAAPLLLDKNSRAVVTIGAGPLSNVVSTTTESNHVIKSSAGNLFGFTVTTGAVSGYVMVFDATSAPVDGAVTPIECYVAPANQTIGILEQPPTSFSTGLTLVFSSTGCFTKTASANAFFSAKVQ